MKMASLFLLMLAEWRVKEVGELLRLLKLLFLVVASPYALASFRTF